MINKAVGFLNDLVGGVHSTVVDRSKIKSETSVKVIGYIMEAQQNAFEAIKNTL